MFPDLDGWKTFSTEISKDVFDKLTQNEEIWGREYMGEDPHKDMTAQPGLKPRRDL